MTTTTIDTPALACAFTARNGTWWCTTHGAECERLPSLLVGPELKAVHPARRPAGVVMFDTASGSPTPSGPGAASRAGACSISSHDGSWFCRRHGLNCGYLARTLAGRELEEFDKARQAAGLVRFDTAGGGADAAADAAPAPRMAADGPDDDDDGMFPRRVRAGRPTPGQRSDPFADRGVFAGPPGLMPSDADVVALFDAVRNKQAVRIQAAPAAAQFATVTTTQTGRPTSYLGGPLRAMPLRIADIVGLPSEDVGWGGTSAFPVMGAGAAGTAAEGAAKTEYAAVTAGAATPTTINAWTDVTGQAQSLANFEAKLRNKLARLISVRENQLLRDTVNGTGGIGAQAFVAGDQAVQILRAAATIEAGVGVRPDLLVFNPADTIAIFGTAVSNTPGLAELAALSMRMFGMAALPMSAQTAGFAMVGAWAACARLVVGLGLTYVTDPYTQLKNNIVTILAEEAVALAVEEPAGFTNVDIVTP